MIKHYINVSGQLLRKHKGKMEEFIQNYSLENGICLIKEQLSYSTWLENETNEKHCTRTSMIMPK